MWDDLVLEINRAPTWAILMVAGVLGFFAYLIIAASIASRRHRRTFTAMAERLGAAPAFGDSASTFALTVDGRPFAVEYRYRGSNTEATGSYRGPRGHVLLTSTPLSGSGWSMHQVDIARRRPFADRLSGRTRTLTADPAFDERFTVVEDGLPVREGWLTAAVRDAVSQFLAATGHRGPVWIQDSRLICIRTEPWSGMDDTELRSMLTHQSTLAAALETTAGRR